MPSRRVIMDGLICLALLNLLLLRVWAQLLPAVVNPANLYVTRTAPHWIHYPVVLAVLFGAAGLAAAGAAAARRGRSRWPRGLGRAALFLLFAAAVNSVAAQVWPAWTENVERSLGLAGGAAVALAFLGVTGWVFAAPRPRLFGVIEGAALVAAPFVLMTTGQALWALGHYDPERFAGARLADDPPAPALAVEAGEGPRVLWILFDELDQRAAFTARPEGLALPELDRLRGEAFFGGNAFAPASETRRSVAAMLLGQPVGWALPDGPASLPCSLEGEPPEAARRDCWSAFPNLFERVREAGSDAGIAGWYHPYCRILADALTACTWEGLPYWDSPRIRDSLGQQAEEVVKAVPGVRLWIGPGRRIRRAHRDAYLTLRSAGLALAVDPVIDLAFLHFPIPHHPDIYDPDRGELSLEDERSYLDNLALVDRTLGEIRSAMLAAGTWERTVVIVTSDHWWRAIHRGDWGLLPEEERLWAGGRNRRIPFLVRFPGQGETLGYPRPFNTRLLYDLIPELLAGGVRDPDGLRVWIDAHRAAAPVPYPVHIPAAGRRPNAAKGPE